MRLTMVSWFWYRNKPPQAKRKMSAIMLLPVKNWRLIKYFLYRINKAIGNTKAAASHTPLVCESTKDSSIIKKPIIPTKNFKVLSHFAVSTWWSIMRGESIKKPNAMLPAIGANTVSAMPKPVLSALNPLLISAQFKLTSIRINKPMANIDNKIFMYFLCQKICHPTGINNNQWNKMIKAVLWSCAVSGSANSAQRQ